MGLNSLTICVIGGLLLSLAGAEVINEAKTYTMEISKMSDLGKDDQVMIEKGLVLIAQYVCHAGNCTSTPNTTGQLTEQSGYLVLTVQNISPIDRFNASKWDRSRKLILKDFTPNEVPSTSTTHTLAEEAHNQTQSLTEPNNMTDTTGRLVGAGAGVGVGVGVLALALAVGIYLESGRNGRIARAIAFFRRISCDSVPNQHDDVSMEMQSLAAPV